MTINERVSPETLDKIIEAADDFITALAGTNEDVHKNDSTKMCQLWDDLNDRHATPAIVKAMARELQQYRAAAEPVVSDSMALAFHAAITDSAVGADDIDDIKTGLRAALANYAAPQVTSAPEIGEIRVGRLPTMNQDEYPGLGDWWVQLRIGEDYDEVLARVYGATPQEANNRAEALACRAAMLNAAPAVQEEQEVKK